MLPARYRSLRRTAKPPPPTLASEAGENRNPGNFDGGAIVQVAVSIPGEQHTRQYIVDVPIAPATTTAANLVSSALGLVLRQHQGGDNNTAAALAEKMRLCEHCVHEEVDLGDFLEREVSSLELVATVQAAWSQTRGDRRNGFVVVSAADDDKGDDGDYHSEGLHRLEGWIRFRSKRPARWSDRYITIDAATSAVYASRRAPVPGSDTPKERTLLFHLSEMNFYRVGSYSTMFALKSCRAAALFEDERGAVVHYFNAKKPVQYLAWRNAVQGARAREVASRGRLATTPAVRRQAKSPSPAPPALAPLIPRTELTSIPQHSVPTPAAAGGNLVPTSDSLLDRLMHGEHVATTSATPESLGIENAKSRALAQKVLTIRRKREHRQSTTPGTTSNRKEKREGNDRRNVRAPSVSSESSAFSFDEGVETVAMMGRGQQETPRRRRHIEMPSSRTSSERVHVSITTTTRIAPVEDDDDEEPLYKKLHQFNLNPGSKNPFLDFSDLPGASPLVAPMISSFQSPTKTTAPSPLQQTYATTPQNYVSQPRTAQQVVDSALQELSRVQQYQPAVQSFPVVQNTEHQNTEHLLRRPKSHTALRPEPQYAFALHNQQQPQLQQQQPQNGSGLMRGHSMSSYQRKHPQQTTTLLPELRVPKKEAEPVTFGAVRSAPPQHQHQQQDSGIVRRRSTREQSRYRTTTPPPLVPAAINTSSNATGISSVAYHTTNGIPANNIEQNPARSPTRFRKPCTGAVSSPPLSPSSAFTPSQNYQSPSQALISMPTSAPMPLLSIPDKRPGLFRNGSLLSKLAGRF
ncbi:uncharacterized protein V1518DRAFT_420611 [Limtongia smithiae]|uniref:uncharacterized protein n=1 Tax=Limtongia smithiae TaxID=1125753 RepID=UPI0034CD735B